MKHHHTITKNKGNRSRTTHITTHGNKHMLLRKAKYKSILAKSNKDHLLKHKVKSLDDKTRFNRERILTEYNSTSNQKTVKKNIQPEISTHDQENTQIKVIDTRSRVLSTPKPTQRYGIKSDGLENTKENSHKKANESPFALFIKGLSPLNHKISSPSVLEGKGRSAEKLVLSKSKALSLSPSSSENFINPIKTTAIIHHEIKTHVMKLDFTSSNIVLKQHNDSITIGPEREIDFSDLDFEDQLACKESMNKSSSLSPSLLFEFSIKKPDYTKTSPKPIRKFMPNKVVILEDTNIIGPKPLTNSSYCNNDENNNDDNGDYSTCNANNNNSQNQQSQIERKLNFNTFDTPLSIYTNTTKLMLGAMNSFSGKETAIHELFNKTNGKIKIGQPDISDINSNIVIAELKRSGGVRGGTLVGLRRRSEGDNDNDDEIEYDNLNEDDNDNVDRFDTEGNLIKSTKQVRICCNCKKSRCLKLYCDCFAAKQYCHGCNCVNCANIETNQQERNQAIDATLERNPSAFKPKVNKAIEDSYSHVNIQKDLEENKHVKGCYCKKSNCLKKYCECYQAGVKCSELCKCESCKNMDPNALIKKVQTLNYLASFNSFASITGGIGTGAAGNNSTGAGNIEPFNGNHHYSKHELSQNLYNNENNGILSSSRRLKQVDQYDKGMKSSCGSGGGYNSKDLHHHHNHNHDNNSNSSNDNSNSNSNRLVDDDYYHLLGANTSKKQKIDHFNSFRSSSLINELIPKNFHMGVGTALNENTNMAMMKADNICENEDEVVAVMNGNSLAGNNMTGNSLVVNNMSGNNSGFKAICGSSGTDGGLGSYKKTERNTIIVKNNMNMTVQYPHPHEVNQDKGRKLIGAFNSFMNETNHNKA